MDQFEAVCQSVEPASVFQTARLNFGVQSIPALQAVSPYSKAPISAFDPTFVWGTKSSKVSVEDAPVLTEFVGDIPWLTNITLLVGT